MQFSIARLMLATVFISVVLGATFASPYYGWPVLTLISVFVVPPFIIVGVVNTRGRRQAFFLGAMISGIPHFILTTYILVMMSFAMMSGANGVSLGDTISDSPHIYVHGIGYLLGIVGGLCGMAAHYFLIGKDKGGSDVQMKTNTKGQS